MKEAVPPTEGGFRVDPVRVAEVLKIGTNLALPVTLQQSHFANQKPSL